MTKPNTKQYQGEPEVTRSGIMKKGTKPPPTGKGQVKVTHKRESRGMSWLRTYVGTVIVVDSMVGMTMIYNLGLDPALQAHAMWAFGISHGLAAVTALFVKLE